MAAVMNFSIETDLIKYRLVMLKDGKLLVRLLQNTSDEVPTIHVFNSKPDKWIVSTSNDRAKEVEVYKVKQEEIYFLNIDHSELSKI